MEKELLVASMNEQLKTACDEIIDLLVHKHDLNMAECHLCLTYLLRTLEETIKEQGGEVHIQEIPPACNAN